MSPENLRNSNWNRLVHPTLRQKRERLRKKLDEGKQLQITDPAIIQPGDILELLIRDRKSSKVLKVISVDEQTRTLHYFEQSFLEYSTMPKDKDSFTGCKEKVLDLLWLGILPKNPWADKDRAEFNPFAACFIREMASGSERT